MKIVRLMVPDSITRISGGSNYTRSRQVEVDAESILKALTTNDYHENWFFPDPESVKVLSIEDSPEGAQGTS